MVGSDYTFKLVTYNINWVHNPIKRTKILSKLKKDKVQAAFLQESHLNQTEHSKLAWNEFKYVFSSSHVSDRRRGVI